MSEQGGEQDRSEQPTPFKLQKARQRGAVARGTDLGFLTGSAAFAAYAWFSGAGVMARLGAVAQAGFVVSGRVVGAPHELLAVTGGVLGAALKPLMLMAGAVFLVVLVFEVVQTGPVFSTEAFRLDFSRLNPATGLKRLFSVRLLVETAKNLLKMAVYGGIAGLAIVDAVRVVTPAVLDGRELAGGLQHVFLRLVAMFLGAALVFAALDQLIVRRDFLKRMRMSRREIRRESRDREGEPRLKQKRKQLHREFAANSRSLRNLPGADVLVTNPTHYAAALRYDPARMAAPRLVSRGAHGFALRLRRMAFMYGVTVVQNPALARALVRCEIDQPIPEALFRPVADIYREMRRRQAPAGEGAAADV